MFIRITVCTTEIKLKTKLKQKLFVSLEPAADEIVLF